MGRCVEITLEVGGKLGEIFKSLTLKNLKGNTPNSGGVTRIELGNLLENFKTGILGEMGSQLDALQYKKRQEEERAIMSILCPICSTKHPQRECPLNNIFVCHIYMDDHRT